MTGDTLARMSESGKWYLAVCQRCSRILPKPFPGEDERDRWAQAHQDATGHQVARVTYAAPQEIER